MSLIRYLDDVEIHLTSKHRTFVVEFEGQVIESALARAFELLCVRHPVLRGRISAEDDGRYLLYVPQDHHPELTVLDGDNDVMLREVCGPWNPAQQLVQLLLIRDSDHGFVAMRVDHAIVDGHSLFTMLSRLWSLYTEIVNDSHITIQSGVALPESPSTVWMRRQGTDPSTHPEGRYVPAQVESCEPVWRLVRLTKTETSRLLARTRAEGTSLHAAICGSVLVALRSQGNTVEPAPMMCRSAVNLRNQFAPPVGATETTNFLGVHRADVAVASHANPLRVGHNAKKQLDAALAEGRIEMGIHGIPSLEIETSLEAHLAVCNVSNMGSVPMFAHPSMITLTDFHLITPKVVSKKYPGHLAYTYNGQLRILCLYSSDSFTDGDVDQITHRIRECLRDIGGQP